MPIYEFRCQSCGEHFEAIVRASESAACPSCKSQQLEKQFSVFNARVAPSVSAAPAACSTCGHPDGPGACARDDWN